MPWLQLKIDITPQQAEALGDALTELGAVAVTLQDAADQPLFEPLPGETKLWNATRVIGLFEATADMPAIIAALRQRWPQPLPDCHADPLEDKDWEREWMDNFHPIRCGEQLWICPSWREPVDPNAVNVLLDPGLAFGTGTHPTTALCLEWLDAHPPRNLDVVDYGCGSGILAVAAALLGARQVAAVDYDPQALIATRDNAAKNGVADRIHTWLPRQCPAARAELLLANILANPLIELAPRFAALVPAGGQIVLSGILTEQAENVAAAYTDWFDMEAPVIRNEWVRLCGTRRAD